MRVETDEGIRIDNNYGRLDLAASLQVTGTPDQVVRYDGTQAVATAQ